MIEIECQNSEIEDSTARMRRLRSQERANVSEVMTQLLTAYVPVDRDKLLDDELNLLIDALLESDSVEGDRRVGRLGEGRALVLSGPSGAGKSRALERLFHKREEFVGYGKVESDCPLVSVVTPSPCTLRLLGEEILKAIGYPVERKLDENVAWELVHQNLKLRQVRFLHIDEVQHVTQSRNQIEVGKMQDTLKGLMQDKDWPVWLILSGLPSVATFLAKDPQVWRRTRHVAFRDLELPADGKLMVELIEIYGIDKGGRTVTTLRDTEFLSRLRHAAAGRLGIIVELIQDAVREALSMKEGALTMNHFAAVYAARTGAERDENVFVVDTDWDLIDTAQIWDTKIPGVPEKPKKLNTKVRKKEDGK
jgi:AAA domain